MIYFRGCVAREKLKNIANATENILIQADIDYRVIDNEPCCGSILLRTGFADDGLDQVKKTAEILNGETILVSCAGCFKTFKKDYKEILGIDINVIHTSQLFSDLVKQKKINIKPSSTKVTYHDSCHLGRQCGEYESPRNVLKSVGTLVEMEHNHENSLCCGSGGGVKSAFPEIAKEIALKRIEEAEKTRTDILVTSCPFCKLNLSENSSLEVLDLSEFIVRCIENE
jgi:Fe-S oxidoreductase